MTEGAPPPPVEGDAAPSVEADADGFQVDLLWGPVPVEVCRGC